MEERKNQAKELRKNGGGKDKEGMRIEDFALGKKLGEGRFGHVYMAIHKASGGIFALKRVPKATLKQSLMIDQFALEVRLQAIFSLSLIHI